MTENTAVGIDIGGTGIKAALVDLVSGELISERVKMATPEGGQPEDIIETTREILRILVSGTPRMPIGVCFPAVVKHGHTMSAANVSPKWIGLPAEGLFANALGSSIHFVNDADAAGYAEAKFGAARGVDGLVVLTTLGTGIGTALINDGVLVPNTEFGHLEIDGHNAESQASNVARVRDGLDWVHWAERLQRYYETLEMLLSPDLILVGGGVSKVHHEFLPLLEIETPIKPAQHRNNAGILGAAALANRFPR